MTREEIANAILIVTTVSLTPEVSTVVVSSSVVVSASVVVSSGSGVVYKSLDVVLSLEEDYGIMMHWNRSGQRKIALAMFQYLTDSSVVF